MAPPPVTTEGPAQSEEGGPAWGDLEGAGIKEGGLESEIRGHRPRLCSPMESTFTFNRPLRKKGVPPPTPWPAGVHYHKPPPPQPSLLSLVTSGIQMWKPKGLVLKGDQQQGRGVAGLLCAQWAGRGLGWCLCGAPSLLAPLAGGTLGIPLGLLGAGGLGCRG